MEVTRRQFLQLGSAGVVFLTGSVGNQEQMDRAIEVARSTEHVRDVKPNLVISRG